MEAPAIDGVKKFLTGSNELLTPSEKKKLSDAFDRFRTLSESEVNKRLHDMGSVPPDERGDIWKSDWAALCIIETILRGWNKPAGK